MKRRYRLIEKLYSGGHKMWQGEMTMKEKLFWIFYTNKWIPIKNTRTHIEEASQDIADQMRKDYNANYPKSEKVLEEYVRIYPNKTSRQI